MIEMSSGHWSGVFFVGFIAGSAAGFTLALLMVRTTARSHAPSPPEFVDGPLDGLSGLPPTVVLDDMGVEHHYDLCDGNRYRFAETIRVSPRTGHEQHREQGS
ncbi:MAG TPA: hypothetical protein VG713_20970 [Pirellulales bacterium]|nr:hypothetical protein [Pirellulales bacterium]